MSTKAKSKRKVARQESLRRRSWALRMALWSALLIGAVAVMAFVVLNGGGDGGGGGGSSRFQPVHKFDTPDYHSLAFHPSGSGVVLYGHHNGLQMTEDGGLSWKAVVDRENWDAMNTVFDQFYPDTVYVAGHGVFFRSDDGGKTWKDVESNLPGLDLHAFAASPNQQGRLYAFVVGYGLYVSHDEGRRWQPLWGEAPQGTGSVLELPDGTLLVAAVDQGILRSEDGGKTWAQSRRSIDSGIIYTMKADPGGKRLYAGTSEGLFVSLDAGKSWSVTSLDDTTVIVVGVNPSDALEVMVINSAGQLFRSRDGGTTWQ